MFSASHFVEVNFSAGGWERDFAVRSEECVVMQVAGSCLCSGSDLRK
jgi:hypothetical protein